MDTTSCDREHAPLPDAVLFDRDGTLIEDVPYNRDPESVRALPGAREALQRLRSCGVLIGAVTNQSGVGLGLLNDGDVQRVDERVEELLGGIDTWKVCPHAPEARCRCRAPRVGLILAACRDLGVLPRNTVVVGDQGADMVAAGRAGARGILVPSHLTSRSEIVRAPAVAGDLSSAVILALGPDRARDARVRDEAA